MWREGGIPPHGLGRFFRLIIPENKLIDLLETRHTLVNKYGYSTRDLDEMFPVEYELLILIIMKQKNDRANQE